MRRLVPLTAAGSVVLALGAVAYVGGWQLGWVELMVLAAGCLVALAVAVPFVIGRMRLVVTHSVDPARVMAGSDDAPQAVVVVRNPGPSSSRAQMIEDTVGDVAHRVRVPALGSGGEQREQFGIPHDRRGVVLVGPAVVARQDPLRLMRRAVVHAEQQRCWVHPRHRVLNPVSAGFAKDLEGPTSDSSPAGDVAFHALRDYAPGDDYRHIHWMSTARRPDHQPVVRHYVDNRLPHILVLLDDRDRALAGQQFEVALEIAASLAVSSMQHREPLSLWNLGGPLLGRARQGGQDDVLDRLTESEPRPDGDPLRVAMTAIRTEAGVSAMVWITGPLGTDELTAMVLQVRRHVRPIIVRVWPSEDVRRGAVRGARILDVHDLEGFRHAWREVTR